MTQSKCASASSGLMWFRSETKGTDDKDSSFGLRSEKARGRSCFDSVFTANLHIPKQIPSQFMHQNSFIIQRKPIISLDTPSIGIMGPKNKKQIKRNPFFNTSSYLKAPYRMGYRTKIGTCSNLFFERVRRIFYFFLVFLSAIFPQTYSKQ